jgi:hypothetical protein
MESITYTDREQGMAIRKLSAVRRKTTKSLRKSLISRATTLRVLADGSRAVKLVTSFIISELIRVKEPTAAVG